MHAVWDDIMTNPLVIPNYMHANEADVLAGEDNDELLRQELQTEMEQNREVLMPPENAAEEDDKDEEEDCEELDLPAPHDPRDPPNPPNDPSNPPGATNPSNNTNTDSNPNTNPNNNTQTNTTNQQVPQGEGEPAWTNEQQHTILLMVKAGYTQEEAAAAILASLPSQVQEGPHVDQPLQADPDQPTQETEGEASMYEEIKQRVQRAGDIDTLFRSMLPSVPLAFMQVQEQMQKETFQLKCPEKEVGGFRALKAEDFANPGAMKNQPQWWLRYFT